MTVNENGLNSICPDNSARTITSDEQGKGAANFLLSTALGITLADTENKDAEDVVVRAAVDKAYSDASRRVLALSDDEQKLKLKSEASKKIVEHVLNLDKVDASTHEGYDAWHKNLCDQLCRIYENASFKNNCVFTYGIAQKWVNMSIKYLVVVMNFLSDYSGMEELPLLNHTPFDKLRSKLRGYIHVPIDSYMFRAIGAGRDVRINPDDLESPCGLGIKRSKRNLPESWSKIDDYDNYLHYQQDIRGCEIFGNTVGQFTPIDWEAGAWLAEARRRQGR